jgi:hypothetical protein
MNLSDYVHLVRLIWYRNIAMNYDVGATDLARTRALLPVGLGVIKLGQVILIFHPE